MEDLIILVDSNGVPIGTADNPVMVVVASGDDE